MTVVDKTNVCGQMRGSDKNSGVGEQNQKSSPSNSIKSELRWTQWVCLVRFSCGSSRPLQIPVKCSQRVSKMYAHQEAYVWRPLSWYGQVFKEDTTFWSPFWSQLSDFHFKNVRMWCISSLRNTTSSSQQAFHAWVLDHSSWNSIWHQWHKHSRGLTTDLHHAIFVQHDLQSCPWANLSRSRTWFSYLLAWHCYWGESLFDILLCVLRLGQLVTLLWPYSKHPVAWVQGTPNATQNYQTNQEPATSCMHDCTCQQKPQTSSWCDWGGHMNECWGPGDEHWCICAWVTKPGPWV